MSQTYEEQVLTELNNNPGGLTSIQLREKLRIQPNVLSTQLWEMKRDGTVARVGGARGRYVYGITQKGKERLPGQHKDPLTRLADSLRGRTESDQTFDDLMKVIARMEDFRLLTGYIAWVQEHSPNLLSANFEPTLLKTQLTDQALTYLGVDPAEYRLQRESLEALLKLS